MPWQQETEKQDTAMLVLRAGVPSTPGTFPAELHTRQDHSLSRRKVRTSSWASPAGWRGGTPRAAA